MNTVPAPSAPIRLALIGAALAACIGWAATSAAQEQVFDTPPRPGAPRPLAIAAPAELRLPNGLRVVLAERRGVQLVTAQLVVLAGSEVDPDQRAGLASMTAGLLTKGTRRHSASALARAAESLGGTLESGASWHQSEVAITVTVPELDHALGLVSETVQHPRFAPAELNRLRVQTLDELKVAYAQPGTLASMASQHLLFGAGTYGHPAGGTPASLQRITRADLLALHSTHYRPDNAVLVLAGDIDAGTALRLARRHFGGWKASGQAPAGAPVRAVGSAMPQTTAVIDMPQSGQAAVVLAVPLPPLGADRAAAAVMNAVLGGGFSSRLNQEIRIKRGLSYSAGSQLDVRRGGGMLRMVVQTKNESAAEVAGLLQVELDRLIAAPVGDDELAARQATLIGDFSRSVETTAGLGSAVKSLIVAGLPSADLRTRIDALTLVTAADVQRFAAAHLGAAQRRAVVAGEAARFADALKATAPAILTVPAGALDLERSDGLTAP
jgi:zinc protease